MKNPIIVESDYWKYAYCPDCDNKLKMSDDYRRLECKCGYNIRAHRVNW